MAQVNKYVAFLRAINVGGHAKVNMSELREAFAAAGCRNVRTHIQSSNVIFESPAQDLAKLLHNVLAKLRNLLDGEQVIMLRTAGEIEEIIRKAPFKDVEAEPGIKLYVAFLSQKPRSKPRLPLVSSREALEAVAISDREVFVVSRRKKNGFFGFPNLLVEKELGVPATTRNWTTVSKIARWMRM